MEPHGTAWSRKLAGARVGSVPGLRLPKQGAAQLPRPDRSIAATTHQPSCDAVSRGSCSWIGASSALTTQLLPPAAWWPSLFV
jgi:hypothetical protein